MAGPHDGIPDTARHPNLSRWNFSDDSAGGLFIDMEIIKTIKSAIWRIRYGRASMPDRIKMLRPKFYHIGENVRFRTDKFGTEPYLISIEDNATIASDVKFITHDGSCFNMARYLGISQEKVDKVGSIVLKENCFVGAYSILMPNTSVGRNSVVAAGSVVTKHIPDNEVWGGNPARFIMTTDDYARRVLETSAKYPWIANKDAIPAEELIALRQNFFFKKDGMAGL